jgi:uncharacterized glyoxalase superfamily protein PhnB
MTVQVTSVFLYVNDIVRSIEFYNEIVGFEIRQVHENPENGEINLAVLRLGNFGMMLHPQEADSEDFSDQRVGVGMHLQLRVEDIDAFYQHCLDQGALLSVSGEPVDQPWNWREFALKDPDGYVWSIYEDRSGGQWS